MLSYNVNYGLLSKSAFGGIDGASTLLDNPDMLLTDGALSFYSAFWYYMWPQYPKPSLHDVMLGYFEPS